MKQLSACASDVLDVLRKHKDGLQLWELHRELPQYPSSSFQIDEATFELFRKCEIMTGMQRKDKWGRMRAVYVALETC